MNYNGRFCYLWNEIKRAFWRISSRFYIPTAAFFSYTFLLDLILCLDFVKCIKNHLILMNFMFIGLEKLEGRNKTQKKEK